MGSTNRPAASQHLEELRQCGEDFRTCVLRQRKVEPAVVEGVVTALRHTPLAGPTALVSRVNGRWGRTDWTAAHMAGAVEQSSCVPGLRPLRRQIAAGQVHDQEAWLLTARLEGCSTPAVPCLGWSGPSADRGMRIAAPTALATLWTPALPRAQVPDSRCWLTVLMTRCDWHVP